ncbi:cache domain-containing sensor histidine kinase [Blautia sp. HCP3S3_G3]|uniref:cache domain-containing sensor histidine kinase n=1 Tax=Blautia sp. HCP3S3_G3 TaxID=3438913 RepID=UPI003F8CE658
MKISRKHSLVRQIYLLFSITILVTLASALLFYTVSFRSLRNKESEYTQNVLDHISQSTQTIAASARLMLNTVAASPDALYLLKENQNNAKFSYKQSLNRLTTEMVKSNSSIVNILLLDTQQNVYSFNGYDYSLVNRLNHLYGIYSPTAYTNEFSGELHLPDSNEHYYSLMTSVYDQGKPATDENRLGFCLILCTAEPLAEICANRSTAPDSRIMILDGNNQILVNSLPSDSDLDEKFIQILKDIRTSFSCKVNGTSYLMDQVPAIPITGWKIASIIPYSTISKDLTLFNAFAFLFIFVLLMAFLILITHIRKNITQPLSTIFQFMQKDPYYTLHHQLEISSPQEMQTLAQNINHMLDQINQMSHSVLQNQARLYEAELANNRAQLEALQSQINPHFLYNTLSTIRGLTYLNKNEEIRTAISALSFIMRYNVKGEDMVLIKDELTCIKNYLRIIEIRFPGRFEIHLQVDPCVMEYTMPRFLLQPLVENSILHGLEPMPGKGVLTLSVSLTPQKLLYVECTDNGVGITSEKLEHLLQMLEQTDCKSLANTVHTHIGLLNIHLRLKLIYGDSYGLSISSEPLKQTTVSAAFPSEYNSPDY